jgi:alkaline phosphatase
LHFKHIISVVVGDQSVDATWTFRSPAERSVKNMVLFIGDGMTPTMMAAARVLSNNANFGKYGTNVLNMEKIGTIGKIMTNGLDSIITDAANSAVAYTTGQKGYGGSLGVYVDSPDKDNYDDPEVETIGEYIRTNMPEMCIGIVTTSEVQDATPASMYAHTRSRNDNKEITDQMINGFH